MVERIADMPPGTLGFRVAGHVRREDYDRVLVPDLRAAMDAGDGLRTLYLIEDLDDMEASALWADTKLGFDMSVRHRGEWERSAIVTDISWMVHAMKVFGWMVPGEARVYPVAELADAKAWVAGGG
ncbi:MAG TPA: STAS/SEC14 domain-containing protein [Miltoncostaea sp.]|nr:STAS/SEC14 domain-containing protein [Miltoncostaea sp.]